MLHFFLLIGQSNMAGRGLLADAERLDTMGGRLKVLRNGRWQTMYRPINPDRPFSGTCLAESFAKAYAEEHPDVDVGIVPCADGGTRLEQWKEGSVLFDNAVNCTRLALRSAHLAGILWHQGEGDCGEEHYPLYLERISAIMKALRHALNDDSVPIVVGGLGDFLKDRAESPQLVHYTHINEALWQFAQETPNTAFVSAKGLTSNPDNLHFNHSSLQEFGLRYYTAFRSIENSERQFDDQSKIEDTERTAMEWL